MALGDPARDPVWVLSVNADSRQRMAEALEDLGYFVHHAKRVTTVLPPKPNTMLIGRVDDDYTLAKLLPLGDLNFAKRFLAEIAPNCFVLVADLRRYIARP